MLTDIIDSVCSLNDSSLLSTVTPIVVDVQQKFHRVALIKQTRYNMVISAGKQILLPLLRGRIAVSSLCTKIIKLAAGCSFVFIVHT